MSSGYWQIEKRREQYSAGKETTQKVKDYVSKWKTRCYSTDIPDEAPEQLSKLNRVPSYKAIAMAILRNDTAFHSIGFSRKETSLSVYLRSAGTDKNLQMGLWDDDINE